MRARIYKPNRTVIAIIKEAIRFIEKSGHMNDCCAEYDEDQYKWVMLTDDYCWCGRTGLLEKLRSLINAC